MPLKNKKAASLLNTIIEGDSLEVLAGMDDNFVDVVLTDPPYFLDKLDNQWDVAKVNHRKNCRVVKSLPAGMKFSQQQGRQFYEWYLAVSKQLFRVLKPGGFFFSFSSPRLYHRMTCAIEDAGFDIRDCFIWLYTMNQPKAMSLNHFIKKMPVPEQEKLTLMQSLNGWKTPQVKSCFEPIAMAQKPVETTYLKNMMDYNVSLVNTRVHQGSDGDRFPANVATDEAIGTVIDKAFLTNKPNQQEKGRGNKHATVKPLSICKYLIALTTPDKAVVLDPFIGSGTTAVACKMLNRNYIGIELNKEYAKIARDRINAQATTHPQKSATRLQKSATRPQKSLRFS